MIRHMLLRPQKFKFHLITVLPCPRQGALKILQGQGLQDLIGKCWISNLYHELLVVAYQFFVHEITFSNIPLDNNWHSVYTVCMEALSSPEMQNLCMTKFPEIHLSTSKLNPCSHIIFLSIFIFIDDSTQDQTCQPSFFQVWFENDFEDEE